LTGIISRQYLETNTTIESRKLSAIFWNQDRVEALTTDTTAIKKTRLNFGGALEFRGRYTEFGVSSIGTRFFDI
jgi:hypothetical protein